MRLRISLTVAACLLGACTTPPQSAKIKPIESEQVIPSCVERAEASDTYTVTDAEWDERMLRNSQTLKALGFSEGDSEPPASHKKPQSLNPPMPTFPSCAAERGLEGYCYVHFDVDAEGRTNNVFPRCTHKLFDQEAARAVQRVTFRPATIDGEPVDYPGIVYPMRFSLVE